MKANVKIFDKFEGQLPSDLYLGTFYHYNAIFEIYTKPEEKEY